MGRSLKTTTLSALGRRLKPPPISWLMEQVLARPHLVSLAAGFTDDATLPVAETRRLLTRLLARRATGEPALQYGSTPGLPALRRLTASRLYEQDAATAPGQLPEQVYHPDAIVITHGSQQLLYLLCEVLCDPGDVVLVEDPTYFVFLGILSCRGVETRGIPLTSEGPDPDRLEAVLEQLRREHRLHRVKMLYLVSYHQNPTGTTTSFACKTAILDLLRHYERRAGHPIYLLEDAAYRELRFAGPDTASALATPTGPERVLYAGTYSKPFATGVRVGFGVLPEPVRSAVLCLKGNHDFGTSNLGQHLLLAALESGEYDRHVIQLRRRYATKASWMTAALRRHFPPEAHWTDPRGGMYVWVRLPRRVRTGPRSALFQRALAADVLYVPGRFCYALDPTRRTPDHEMRLSFGHASEQAIRTGVARLGRVLAALYG